METENFQKPKDWNKKEAKQIIENNPQWWLIDNGGIPMWMQGTKQGLTRAGLKVIGGPRE